MQNITREELRRQMEQGEHLVLIEVLDAEAYRDFHLPGAANVPVSRNFEEHILNLVPDKDMPVVVYCQNQACTASPRAARIMEQLGYRHVYDYAAGKDDWRAAGLPVETGAGAERSQPAPIQT